MDFKSKIILIYGPTASGKSKFAIELAKKIDEVVMWYPKDSSNSLEGTPSDARFAYIKYDK